MHNQRIVIGVQFGVRTVFSGRSTTFEFSAAMGSDANHIADMICVDHANEIHRAEAPNRCVASGAFRVLTVERSAALDAYQLGDFFGLILDPGAGGPGFVLGYVSDVANDGKDQMIPASFGCDVNGLFVVRGATSAPPTFRRGDCNGDGATDVSDAIATLRLLFQEAAPLPCESAADANDDGSLDISDPVCVLRHVFLGVPAIRGPFPECGQDATSDELTCESYPPCAGG